MPTFGAPQVTPPSSDSTNSIAVRTSPGQATLLKLKSKSVYETKMRLWLEGSIVDHGLSSRCEKPSFAIEGTGSLQVLPPSVEVLIEIAANGLKLLSK